MERGRERERRRGKEGEGSYETGLCVFWSVSEFEVLKERCI